MKRGGPLKRKTPLRSSGGLTRKARLRAKGVDSSKRVERDAVREQVFARDGYRCRLEAVDGAGACFGPLTYHHRRKASQGGRYTISNGASLCAHHNDALEADADLAAIARRLGLVLRTGDVA